MSDYLTHQTDLNKIEADKHVRGEIFLVVTADLAKTAKGKDYYNLSISNKHGSCGIKIWSPGDVLSEGKYIDLYMKGVHHPKYGKQWNVSHYALSDYPGDSDFVDTVEDDNIEKNLEILKNVSWDSSNASIENLYSMYLEILEEESESVHVPANLKTFSSKGGFLKYSVEILRAVSSFCSKENNYCSTDNPLTKDILKISALLHSIGSLYCYDSIGELFVRYTPNTAYLFSGIEHTSLQILNKLNFKSSEMDTIVFNRVYQVCRESYQTGDFSSKEASILSGCRVIVNSLEYIDSLTKGSTEFFIKKGSKTFINGSYRA